VVRAAARHGIMLDVHEPIKPTGLRRTYPNLLTAEGVRGMEWNAWSTGNPPEHTVMLPFTRMLAGPLDYTPGIFDLRYDRYPHQVARWDHKGMNRRGRMSTTLAKQLALYVVLHSPLQMAADLVENYVGHPAFQLIREVPVSWERTLVLGGEVGRHVTIARQRRGGDDWYVGSITDARPRRIRIALDFLDPKKTYVATFYRDGARAHFRTAPGAVEVEQRRVVAGQKLTLSLRPGGGQAIAIRAVPQDHPAWPTRRAAAK
jgi:alpha-glucosidase